VEVRCDEGVAIDIGPELCVLARESVAGRPAIEPRKNSHLRGKDDVAGCGCGLRGYGDSALNNQNCVLDTHAPARPAVISRGPARTVSARACLA
jgi:hypothetical protein